MFIRLAIRNIRKNYNRSLLAICGMIVAAAVLTGGGAFAQLYPERGYFGYRQGAGGDILVFPNLLAFDEQHLNDPATGWRFNRRADDLASLSTYDADPRTLLEPNGPAPQPFRLDALPQALTATGRELYPYLALPVTVRYRDARTGGTCERSATLRGRVTSIDRERYRLAECITDGRYFTAGDAGANVAVVNAPALNEMMLMTEVAALAGLGANQEVTVTAPTIREIADGELLYDYGQTTDFRFKIVGAISLKTSVVPLRDEDGQKVYTGDGKPIPVQMYWDRAEIYVPRETWERIYAQVSGGIPVYTRRIGVVVRDTTDTKALTAQLGTAMPGTAIAVPDLVATQTQRGQIVVPRNLTVLLNALTYSISGLLTAANMHVLISQRQAEIGVMKAIGVGSKDIFALTMLEIAGFSVVGALTGFLAVTGLLWLFGYWTSGFTVAGALALTAKSFLRVAGFTLGTAVIFGLAPALRATHATTVSVLRAE